jgi:hypothetical protein
MACKAQDCIYLVVPPVEVQCSQTELIVQGVGEVAVLCHERILITLTLRTV